MHSALAVSRAVPLSALYAVFLHYYYSYFTCARCPFDACECAKPQQLWSTPAIRAATGSCSSENAVNAPTIACQRRLCGALLCIFCGIQLSLGKYAYATRPTHSALFVNTTCWVCVCLPVSSIAACCKCKHISMHARTTKTLALLR